MKKCNNILISVLAVTFLAVSLGGCGGKDLGEYTFTPLEYEYDYYAFRKLEPDEGVTLDGKFDEAFWQDKKELHFGYDDIKVRTKTYMGEYAVYVGVYVEDNCIYDNPKREDWRNTSIELHLARGNATAHTDAVQLRIEAGGRTGSLEAVDYSVISYGWDYQFVPFYARIHIDGELNSSECEGIGFEVEIPWSSLGMSGKGHIGCLPAYNHTNGYEMLAGVERLHLQAMGDMNDPTSYPLFGETGFLGNNEEPDDIMGSSATGRSLTAGWDWSRKEERIARTTKAGQQFAFFKQAPLASDYSFTTRIANVDGAKAGVICGMNNRGWIVAFLTFHGESRTLEIVRMDDYGWYYNEVVNVNSENCLTDVGCKMDVDRTADTIVIKLDDEEVLSISTDFLQGDSVPGLFTIDAFATYSEYFYTQNN